MIIERYPLAHTPTPLQTLDRLSSRFGGPQLLVKRDDCTGLAFGGNKTRKLELLVADALDEGAQLLLTTGAAQSNHCRQTAAAAASAGLSCRLVLVGEKPSRKSGNLFLDQLFGAEVVWTDKDRREQRLDDEYQLARSVGNQPYLIPYGGSNALGAAAYYLAFTELADQLEGRMPDWIVFASSSGGTQAGLAAGALLTQARTKILGISVDEPAEVLSPRVASLAEEVCAIFGKTVQIPPSKILVNDQYLGEGYGKMGALEEEAIQLFARTEGLLLDPVYTGRAAGGLVDLIENEFFQEGDRVVFWHTGGTPGLFAERYLRKLAG